MPFDFPNAPTAGDVYTGYTFDGISWNITDTVSVNAVIGDVKATVTLVDHSGWVRMDGRLVSTLTTSQQAAAATLGWTTNLPDAVNKVLMQTTGTIGSAGGSNVLTQANLPAVNLTANMGNTANTTTSQAASTAATSSEAPDHHHPMQACTNDGGTVGLSELLAEYPGSSGAGSGGKVWRRPATVANTNNGNLWMSGRGMDYAGKHTHSMTVPAHTHTVDIPDHNHSVPLGGSGTAINPAHIVVNQFVYLGL